MKVIFKTPGLLDIRSFTVMGLTAKPNSDNPIGKFGTGLKYAIAVLLRSGAKVRLFIGETEYEFYTAEQFYRGKEFNQVKLRKRKSLLKRWQYEELPFTTEYGRFWKLWQAFRELESNTRDEGGVTFTAEEYSVSSINDDSDCTIIEVDSPEFYEVYQDRDKVFLPNSLTARHSSGSVQVFNEPSNYIYWRGIRVFDLEKPSMYTYNILRELELTEDRTLKNIYYAVMVVAEAVACAEDERWINAVLTAKESSFEHQLDFTHVYATPSKVFKDIMSKKIARDSYYRPNAFNYFERYAPKAPEVVLSLEEELEWQLQNCETHKQRLKRFLLRLKNCEIKELPPALPDDDLPF